MTTNVTPKHYVLIRKDPTFVAVSGDIRATDETVQVVVLFFLSDSLFEGMNGSGTLQNG